MTQPSRSPYWQAFNMAMEMGFTIAIPLAVFGLAGRYADRAFGTSPWLLVAGLVVSLVVTTFILIRRFSQIIKDIEQQTKK